MSLARALDGLRVLEVGDGVSAAFATKLLADLGADVVKIERPRTGDRARLRAPFAGGVPHPEKSGLFLYLNCNKRGITLDLTSPGGHDVLRRLVDRADLLVHNVHPAAMAEHGLDWDALSTRNPRLVMTSITPFGLVGPQRALARDRRRPLERRRTRDAERRPGTPGASAAQGVRRPGRLPGRAERRRSPRWAHSSRDSRPAPASTSTSPSRSASPPILELTFEFWPYTRLVASRLGAKPIQPLDFLECRDGWIFICCVEEHQWRHFVELMGSPEWAEMELFENRIARGANFDALQIFLQEWCATQSVYDLYERAQKRRIPFAPVSTMGDLLGSEHLKARGFFATIDHPVAGAVIMPGAPYHFSAHPVDAPHAGAAPRTAHRGGAGRSRPRRRRALAREGLV